MGNLSSTTAALGIVLHPPPPGLYVTTGPHNLVSRALEILSKSIAGPARLVWVDGSNAFNAYLVALAARSVLKDPARVLRSFYVARPFTCYQLEAMVTEKLLPTAQRVHAHLSVVADPLRLFMEAEGRDTQIRQCYARFLQGLQAAATERAVLVLSTTEHPPYTQSLLSSATRLTKIKEETHGTHIAHHDSVHSL